MPKNMHCMLVAQEESYGHTTPSRRRHLLLEDHVKAKQCIKLPQEWLIHIILCVKIFFRGGGGEGGRE